MRARWTLAALSAVGVLGVVSSSTGGCFYPSYEFDGAAVGGGGASTTSTDATTATSSSDATTSTTSSTSASTSSAGGGGSSTTSTTTAATTTTTGSGTGEDCLNGMDDDGDTDVDCADTECQPGFACVDDIPTGWGVYGYVALAQALPGQEPACPADYPDQAYMGGATPLDAPATCAACVCGAPTGGTCLLPDMDPVGAGVDAVQVSNKACGQQPVFVGYLKVPMNWDGNCYGTQGYLGGQTNCGGPCNVSVSTGAPVVSGNSCAASGGAATVDPFKFAVSAKACGGAATGGGCGATQACLPKPTGSFEPGVCIAKLGDDVCPAPFDVKYSFSDPADAVDDRDCSACTCDAPTGSTCAASVGIYSDNTTHTCNTLLTTVTAGACVNIAGNPAVYSKKLTITQPPTGGSCAPTAGGGQPIGSVTLGQPTTVCCTSG